MTLQIRIGVNTGPVVAGDRRAGQALVTGDAVNTAARLEQAAGPGEILIGEETFALARDAIEAEPVDPLALKGKADVVDAYRLFSVRAGRRRARAPPGLPHGRARPQLRMLLDAFEAATTEDACHLFTVWGRRASGSRAWSGSSSPRSPGRAQVLSGRCLSYGEGITFWPIAEMAIQAAGIAEDDPPERARAELRELLEGTPDGETRRRAPLRDARPGRLGAGRALRGRSAGSSRRSGGGDRSSPCSTTSTGQSRRCSR